MLEIGPSSLMAEQWTFNRRVQRARAPVTQSTALRELATCKILCFVAATRDDAKAVEFPEARHWISRSSGVALARLARTQRAWPPRLLAPLRLRNAAPLPGSPSPS